VSTTVLTLTPPDDATLTPPGYCWRCGTLDGDRIRIIHGSPDTSPLLMEDGGGCAASRIQPEDPTTMVMRAVAAALHRIAIDAGLPTADGYAILRRYYGSTR
jgi:hypothetical protein